MQNNSNNINSNNSLNSNNNSNISLSKRLENISKKNHSKQISISSIQSPEHKAVYFKEENKNFKIEIHSTKNSHHQRSQSSLNDNLHLINPKKKISYNKKINLQEYLISNSPKKGNEQSYLYMNFLSDRYGEEKIKKLISLVENNLNPFEDLTQIKDIVGEDYKIAVKFLSNVIDSS